MRHEAQALGENASQHHRPVSWSALFTFTRISHLSALIPAVCLSLASGVVEPTMTIFAGRFFNAFADFSANTISSSELMDRVRVPVFAFIVLGGSTIFLRGAACSCWTIFGEMQARKIREDLFQGLLEKDLEWFEMRERGVGNLLTRLQTQIRELQIATSLPMGNILTSIVEGFTAIGIAFYYSWKLTLIILAAVPVIALAIQIPSRQIQPLISLQNDALLKASKISYTAISQISLIKCFNSQNLELLQYVGPIVDAAKLYAKQIRMVALQTGLVKFITTSISVPTLWYGNVLVHNGSFTAGKVVTTFWATFMSVQAFQSLLPPLIVLERGRLASAALRSVMTTVKGGRKIMSQEKGLYPNYCDGDIQMSGVSFAYPARPEHYVLQNCHFRFPARKITFLVGRSGSGKSTVGNLLLRFYPASNGTITLDGHDTTLLDPAFLRNNITFIQQQSILFNETILKNIAFGHQYHDHVEYEQVETCLDSAGLQTTIASLPEGVMTSVGMRGTALSGGQKQRVALARARLRNTPILVLDEAFSALDYISTTAVMEQLRNWRSGKTTVVITHDMSLINDDDYVFVLADGLVIGQDYKRSLSQDLINVYQTNSARSTPLEFTLQSDQSQGSQHVRTTSTMSSSNRLSVSVTQQNRTRRDSLEFQLKAVAQDRYSSTSRYTRRTQYLSGFVSNRPSLVAAFDDITRPPIPAVPAQFLTAGQRRYLETTSGRQKPVLKRRRSLRLEHKNGDWHLHKALPTPQVFETTEAYRRVSGANNLPDISPNERSLMPMRKILSTVWPELDSKARLKFVAGLVAVVTQASMPACFAYVLMYIFQTLYTDLWKGKALKYSLLLLAIALGDGIASFLLRFLLETGAQVWSNKIRVQAMRRILEQPRSWFDQEAHSIAYLTSALDRNADDMRSLVGRFLPLLLCSVAMAIVTIVWALAVCWKLTLVALGAAPFIVGLTKTFDVVSTRWESRTNNAGELVGDTFDETFTNIKTVRALTLESYFHRKYHLATNEAFAVGLRRGGYIGLFFGLSECTLNFVMALIFYYGATLARDNRFSNTQILHSISLLMFGSAAANGVLSFIPQLASTVDGASRLLHLARMPLSSHEYNGHLRLDRHDPQTLCGPIHFVNNTFYYPTRSSVPALNQLNLYIAPRKCTAIVGPSGSGKSTIARLLLGLYPSTADHIVHTASDASDGPPSLTLSGRDIRTLDLPSLREMVVLVPQTPVIFSASVRENIIYGLEPTSKRAGQGNIQHAAQQAGIHDFVMSLPNHYDTIIGDGGLGVSGGQAQRIVLARALVRRPKILVLDEPTSALDSESAEVIKQSLGSILARHRRKSKSGDSGGLTVIIITHARDMMEFADTVVVMEAGSVVEEGGFGGLMAKKGRLWDMLRGGSMED